MKQGWEIKKLGEIASFSQGIQVGLEQHLTEPKEGYVRFIRIVDYTQNTDDIRYIPNPGEKYFVNENDIVMVRYGTPGLIGRGKTGVIANNLFRIKIERNDITNDYLSLFLSQDNIQNYLSTQGSATMPALNFGQLKTVEVKFPPLPEQQRIVSILDEAFAAIARAKAIAEQNFKNAAALFESYLQGVFEKKGEGWEERKLGESDLLEIIDGDRGKNYPTQKDFLDEGFCLFMNTKNVRPDGFEFETTMFINEAKDKAMGKGKLKKNDVVMTTRGTIGNLGVYDDSVDFDNIRINSGMLIFRPNTKVITPHYLFETFRSGLFKAQIKKCTTGAAQPQLPIKTLVNFTIPVPKSIEIQQTIVRQLDALRAKTQKLEAIYQQKLLNLEELKKSLLQKAFAGELTT